MKRIKYFLFIIFLHPIMLIAYLSSSSYRRYRRFYGDLWEEVKKAQRDRFGI